MGAFPLRLIGLKKRGNEIKLAYTLWASAVASYPVPNVSEFCKDLCWKSDEHEEDTIKEDLGFEEEIDKMGLNCFVCNICIYTDSSCERRLCSCIQTSSVIISVEFIFSTKSNFVKSPIIKSHRQTINPSSSVSHLHLAGREASNPPLR